MFVHNVLKITIPVKSLITEEKRRRRLCRMLGKFRISKSWNWTRYLLAVVLNFRIFCSPRGVILYFSAGLSVFVIRLFFDGPDWGDSLALFLPLPDWLCGNIDAILTYALLRRLEDNLYIDKDCAFSVLCKIVFPCKLFPTYVASVSPHIPLKNKTQNWLLILLNYL